ncbi:hypothetical protein F4821DRAFT_250707 [Hypoxylon rubiginosum]|uniref:Uncharacterized protein n=1 Tax=Hypoxylon rubiginosum TaxID=110542 RepID=A0ACC0CKE3_9PEZI|nr:hypothetical protein F4821DRAFT_250707 [Hypoxylon rubiginosum]
MVMRVGFLIRSSILWVVVVLGFVQIPPSDVSRAPLGRRSIMDSASSSISTTTASPDIVIEIIVDVQFQNGSKFEAGQTTTSSSIQSSLQVTYETTGATTSSLHQTDLTSLSSIATSSIVTTPRAKATSISIVPFPLCNATIALEPTGTISASRFYRSDPTTSPVMFSGRGTPSSSINIANVFLVICMQWVVFYPW